MSGTDRNINFQVRGTDNFVTSIRYVGTISTALHLYSDRHFFYVPREAEVALGVPGRLRPRITSMFGITRVVGR
jgi:hypothetical protein